jgi:hypothetical protein
MRDRMLCVTDCFVLIFLTMSNISSTSTATRGTAIKQEIHGTVPGHALPYNGILTMVIIPRNSILLVAFVIQPQYPHYHAWSLRHPPRFSKKATMGQSHHTLRRPSKLCMANNGQSSEENRDSLFQKSLTLAIWSLPLDALLIHFSGWNHFLSNLSIMKANASPDEFGAALQFWSLGAFSHPLMDAAFGISEVLHASPGPRPAGLVPYSFLLASALLAIALVQWERLRALAISTCLALFLAYVGTGLDSPFPDYNIQLDDSYQGQVVRGCPSPEAVQSADIRRQSFDYSKYQGRWYWHKVHDWTQFHQMYDTTLDIHLTPTGGYINTLTVKGPSPSSSPLSWDKSPLLQGIRYSWQGVIDPTAGFGVSIESGFGVTFPNYIIDATDDSSNSNNNNNNQQYQELVQFQCIQVGGIRLYEGVDFMSRSPTMTEEQLERMHQRAAVLNPYGASPEQMHRIEQQQQPQQQVEANEWQRLWNTLGIEKYLDQSLKE